MSGAHAQDDVLATLPRVQGASLVTAVVSQIEQRIEEGQLRAGDQLPSESVLGQQFGVSRTVVREALARLAAKGLVEVRNGAGGGSTVREPSAALVSDSLRRLFQPEADAEHHQRILEVRRLLEVEIAGLAAERHTPADLEQLDRILADNQAAGADRESFAQLDVAFHTALAAATQNELFTLLLDSLGGVLLPLRRLGYNTPGNPERALAYHRMILDAVRAGDGKAARRAMRAHLIEAEDTLRIATALRGRAANAAPEPDSIRLSSQTGEPHEHS